MGREGGRRDFRTWDGISISRADKRGETFITSILKLGGEKARLPAALASIKFSWEAKVQKRPEYFHLLSNKGRKPKND